LYLWRVDEQWHGRFLDGSSDKAVDTFSTIYLLWGTSEDTRQDNVDERFLLLADGEEGLRHAPPRPKNFDADNHYLALTVQHYVAYDGDGQAYVAASRLVGFQTVKREKQAEGNQ
jgi:CRISPR-associated protein (TIGR03984 family)